MKKYKANKYSVCKECDFNERGYCVLLMLGSTCTVRTKQKISDNYYSITELLSKINVK
jgi:hypothetical protein